MSQQTKYEIYFIDEAPVSDRTLHYKLFSHSYDWEDAVRKALPIEDPSRRCDITFRTRTDYLREGHTDEIDPDELEMWRREQDKEDEQVRLLEAESASLGSGWEIDESGHPKDAKTNPVSLVRLSDMMVYRAYFVLRVQRISNDKQTMFPLGFRKACLRLLSSLPEPAPHGHTV